MIAPPPSPGSQKKSVSYPAVTIVETDGPGTDGVPAPARIITATARPRSLNMIVIIATTTAAQGAFTQTTAWRGRREPASAT
jgi:hypothetical protein